MPNRKRCAKARTRAGYIRPIPRPTPAPIVLTSGSRSENPSPQVVELVSALTLQGPDVSSSENLLDNESLEQLFTAGPQTVPHNSTNGSSSTYPLSPEKLVAGAAESSSVLTLQKPDVSSMDEFLDSSSQESITASPQTGLHNIINSSSSTSPSTGEKLVAGAVESAYAPTLEDTDVSSSDVDSSSEESDDDIPWTVPHNIANASSSSISSLGSKILLRNPPGSTTPFYIRMDRRGLFWVYPCVDGPFKSIDSVDHSITLFDAICRGERFVTPKEGPYSSSSKNDSQYRHLIQALLDQYSDDHNLRGSGALELEDLLREQAFYEKCRWYHHFNFTIKQSVDGKNLVFAEVSHLQGIKLLDVNCFSMIDAEDDGGHCYGCKKNRNTHMIHPNMNQYAGGRLDTCFPIVSDDEEEDAGNAQGYWHYYYGNPVMKHTVAYSSPDIEEEEEEVVDSFWRS